MNPLLYSIPQASLLADQITILGNYALAPDFATTFLTSGDNDPEAMLT